jgi:4-hydroxybenzoate polyprenyltransferase
MVLTWLAAVALLLLAALGVFTATTGWMPPMARGRVVRPELWGLGALAGALGMGTAMSLRWWADSLTMDNLGGATAFALIVLGGVLQWRAQRPAAL